MFEAAILAIDFVSTLTLPLDMDYLAAERPWEYSSHLIEKGEYSLIRKKEKLVTKRGAGVISDYERRQLYYLVKSKQRSCRKKQQQQSGLRWWLC